MSYILIKDTTCLDDNTVERQAKTFSTLKEAKDALTEDFNDYYTEKNYFKDSGAFKPQHATVTYKFTGKRYRSEWNIWKIERSPQTTIKVRDVIGLMSKYDCVAFVGDEDRYDKPNIVWSGQVCDIETKYMDMPVKGIQAQESVMAIGI